MLSFVCMKDGEIRKHTYVCLSFRKETQKTMSWLHLMEEKSGKDIEGNDTSLSVSF